MSNQNKMADYHNTSYTAEYSTLYMYLETQ